MSEQIRRCIGFSWGLPPTIWSSPLPTWSQSTNFPLRPKKCFLNWDCTPSWHVFLSSCREEPQYQSSSSRSSKSSPCICITPCTPQSALRCIAIPLLLVVRDGNGHLRAVSVVINAYILDVGEIFQVNSELLSAEGSLFGAQVFMSIVAERFWMRAKVQSLSFYCWM